MRRLFFSIGVVVLVAAATLGTLWQRYQGFLATPLNLPTGGYVFQLEPGTGGHQIVEQLAAAGLTRVGWEWKLLMRLDRRVFRAGEYRLQYGMTPPGVLRLLARGEVVQYRFTLVEGWTFAQLASALTSNKVLQHEFDLLDPSGKARVAAALDIETPEGWFLPETYQFVRGDSDFDVLSRAHDAMRRALDEAWRSRAPGLPLTTPYQMLTLASIVEKETAVDAERPRIAGVFIRRLQRGMLLQTDPTVIYGLGAQFDGNLRKRDLEADTPYNTYTRRGLPPTPIAMPGRASLMAVAQPSDEEALYFVADGKGGHSFSATLAEHQAAVRKLIGRN